MPQITPWIVGLIYLIPIVGTITQIWRRFGEVWRMGESLRALLPEDRLYKKIKGWDQKFVAWKNLHHFRKYASLKYLNLIAGKLEYSVGHIRDYTFGLYMMGFFVYQLTLTLYWDSAIVQVPFSSLFYHGFFASLSLWTYRRHVAAGLKMTEFVRLNRHVHPQEFFNHYYRLLGPAAVPVPVTAKKTVNPANVSYLTGAPSKQTLWTWIHGVYDTTLIARSTCRAIETIGKNYGREVFDAFASLWGSRFLQLFHAKMTVTGLKKFHSLEGKVILAINHKTYLDFTFLFFALSGTHLASGRSLRPRFMAAKDHLFDNKLIYSGFGIGKTIESVDMIFVDRRGRGKQAIIDACKDIREKEVEIAMFPQGTRALPNFGEHGERMDAGYYTTGTAKTLKKELGHLKKGCSFLALDAAIEMKKDNKPVHIVTIGIKGDATILPRGSFKVQTEGEILCNIGEVITLNPSDVEGLEKPKGKEPQTEGERRYVDLLNKTQEKIDQGIVGALGIHKKLTLRFLDQIKKRELISKEKILKINGELGQSSRSGKRLPFVIIDRIYALPFPEQEVYLKKLAELLFEGATLSPLRDVVTDQMVRYRKSEMKSAQKQEEAKKTA